MSERNGLNIVKFRNRENGQRRFLVEEFPTLANGTSVLKYMDADTINALFQIRIDWGLPIYPSTIVEGHVRPEGGRSQHNTDNWARLSKATDFFPEGNVIDCWFMIQQKYKRVGGIGIYFDTNRFALQPGPMLHIDTRPRNENGRPVMWFRADGRYYTLNNNKAYEIFFQEAHKYCKTLE